jgi:hypothetical protein
MGRMVTRRRWNTKVGSDTTLLGHIRWFLNTYAKEAAASCSPPFVRSAALWRFEHNKP